MTDVPSNGSSPAVTTREQLVEATRLAASGLLARREELQAELAEVDQDLRAYERAVAALAGETLRGQPIQKRGRPSGEGRQPRPGAVRQYASRVSDERLAEIKDVIVRYARDHEEFRQTDIRALTGHHSSIMATAFEQLRQEPHNLIRLARQSRGGPGSGKWFRLTRAALAERGA